MTAAQHFFIKEGYRASTKGVYFEDSLATESELVHQPDVYALAAQLGRLFNCDHVLDIGCGRGQKLIALHPEFSIIGIDFGSNLEFCAHQYSFGQWIACDLETAQLNLLPPELLKTTLIICSDVVEHLVDPSGLLTTLASLLQFAPLAIVTTPERDLVRGTGDMGPPANPAHIREWNLTEFEQLLIRNDYNVAFMGLTYNNNRDWKKKTILAVLHGKALGRNNNTHSNDFRVVAVMTAYNEEDIIFQSIKHLIDSGIHVYLIDNWSTDGTVAAAKPLMGHGLYAIEQFPASGPTQAYDWHELLLRVEAVAQNIDADWIIHHDVDEIRESPWPNLTLRDALRYVDQLGFNAIDHTVIDFPPLDNAFIPGEDLRKHFTHGTFGRRPGHFLQIKAWKNLHTPVSLAESGGHDVNFEGRKVFPYKFLLRHYPIRSQQHGTKKVMFERKVRFNTDERETRGWHRHYDHIQHNHQFLQTAASQEISEDVDFHIHFLVERISGIGIVRNQTRNFPHAPQTERRLSKTSFFGLLKSRVLSLFRHSG